MSERNVPYFCPFCAGEDLHPCAPDGAGDTGLDRAGAAGAWECRECLRVFTVRLVGLAVPR